jgi:hypothetical protein
VPRPAGAAAEGSPPLPFSPSLQTPSSTSPLSRSASPAHSAFDAPALSPNSS